MSLSNSFGIKYSDDKTVEQHIDRPCFADVQNLPTDRFNKIEFIEVYVPPKTGAVLYKGWNRFISDEAMIPYLDFVCNLCNLDYEIENGQFKWDSGEKQDCKVVRLYGFKNISGRIAVRMLTFMRMFFQTSFARVAYVLDKLILDERLSNIKIPAKIAIAASFQRHDSSHSFCYCSGQDAIIIPPTNNELVKRLFDRNGYTNKLFLPGNLKEFGNLQMGQVRNDSIDRMPRNLDMHFNTADKFYDRVLYLYIKNFKLNAG